jgi:hypothetical protein
MANPVNLPNGRAWTKQGDATDHFKDILARYQTGQQITQPKDHEDLVALITVYDRDLPTGSATKAGSGITHFSKELAGGPGFSTPCFYVHRSDSTKIDFSYIQAVKSAAKMSKRPAP